MLEDDRPGPLSSLSYLKLTFYQDFDDFDDDFEDQGTR